MFELFLIFCIALAVTQMASHVGAEGGIRRIRGQTPGGLLIGALVGGLTGFAYFGGMKGAAEGAAAGMLAALVPPAGWDWGRGQRDVVK